MSADRPLLRQRLAERRALSDAPAHRVERSLGAPYQAHAVVHAPRPQTPLRDLEAAPLAKDYVRRRHPHVLEDDFGVAVRRVVVAEDGERAHDADARRIHRHKYHRLLPMPGRFRVGLAHEDGYSAARVARATRPPLPP